MSNFYDFTVKRYGSNHVQLPNWLDSLIFDDYEAVYERHPEDVKRTPDNMDFDKIYLGTYFPRSFAEAYCIAGRLLDNQCYFDSLKNESEINVFDFCCGIGGEIIGLISILQERLPYLKRINIDAFDANEIYIFTLNHIIEDIKNKFRVELFFNAQCIFVEKEQHWDDIVNTTTKNYHIILSFKALNEFIQSNSFPGENIYYKVTEKFIPLLTNNGILILSDLTHKFNEGGFFYPEKMNVGLNEFIRKNDNYKSIMPYSCFFYERKCKGCYMQDIIYVSHTRQSNDVSKIAFRIIGKSVFAKQLVADIKPSLCRAQQPFADKTAPYK